MNIKIIGELETGQDAIDQLVEEVPKLFPESCLLKIVDDKDRYQVKRDNVWRYGENVTIEESQFLDGMSISNLFWFNVRSVILQYYKMNDSNDKIMVLSHRAHIDLAKEIEYPMPKFVGMNPRGRIDYSGHCDNEYGAIVLGIPNETNLNHVKAAAHEIAHMFLTPLTGNHGHRADHCENSYERLRCLMNTSEATDVDLAGIGLRFCLSCYEKLEQASALAVK